MCQHLDRVDAASIAERRHTVLGRDVVSPGSGLISSQSSSSVVLALLGHVLNEVGGLETGLDGVRVTKHTGPGADGDGDGEVDALLGCCRASEEGAGEEGEDVHGEVQMRWREMKMCYDGTKKHNR